MRWLGGLLLALLLAAASPAAAHEITFSQVNIHLEEGGTTIAVQLPVVGLLQQDPPVLPEGTTAQMLAADPLPADAAAAIADLLTTRLQLLDGASPLALTVATMAPSGTTIAATLTAPPVTGALTVDANLFPDDALHKIFATVYRGATLAGQYALDRDNPALTLDAPERPLWDTVVSFVGEGIHHIFIGPDHILFVLALILLGGRLWSQVKIITAFTVAHSITLTLATLDIVQLPSRLVESVIALSIVVVGLHDLRQLHRRRAASRPAAWDPRIALAFLFGLVHGFGFASVLAELDLPQSALAWSLAAFNVGVEIGQVTIVLLATPVLLALRRYAAPGVRQTALTGAACLVVAMGGFWLWQRALGG